MFSQQISEINKRLAQLYVGARADVELQSDLLLPRAFKELGTASEELQVAVEEIFQQTEELAVTRSQVEAERQRYKDLFEFMPIAYLITDEQGKISQLPATERSTAERGGLYLKSTAIPKTFAGFGLWFHPSTH